MSSNTVLPPAPDAPAVAGVAHPEQTVSDPLVPATAVDKEVLSKQPPKAQQHEKKQGEKKEKKVKPQANGGAPIEVSLACRYSTSAINQGRNMNQRGDHGTVYLRPANEL